MNPVHAQYYWAQRLMSTPAPVNRGTWQSQKTDMLVREADNVLLAFDVPATKHLWQEHCQPDLPWAETHFLERISGEPMNPAPSYIDWPWHSDKERDRFRTTPDAKFDHTYPERFWPRYDENFSVRRGIRFQYGDLYDVIQLLQKEPFTRQAYLPIYFPEDTGSAEGQRVPCTLGYHFIRNGPSLDLKYFLRSCDITRHFLNDAYMAGRLLQWATTQVAYGAEIPFVGTLTMFISNFHMFLNDEWRFR